MPIKNPLFETLITRLIKQYNDEYLCIERPVQAFSVSLNEKTGIITLDFKGKTLAGVFSAPFLLVEAYWRDIEEVLDFDEYSSISPGIYRKLDFFHHEEDKENFNDYLIIISLLLKAGLKKEAMLCLTNLQTINYFGLVEEEEINERIPSAILSHLTNEERNELFIKVDSFQGRKKASSSALLKTLIELMQETTLIRKILCVREMLFPIRATSYSSDPVKIFNMCIEPLQSLMEYKEPLMLQKLYPVMDILISHLHKICAYEEALVLLNIAIERQINLPMQYLRRWEIHYYLNDREKAQRDWNMVEDYYDRYQTAQKNKKEVVFWEGSLLNHKANRLLTLAKALYELSEGIHPCGYKTKKLKWKETEQTELKERARQAITEAHNIIGNYKLENIETDYKGFLYSISCARDDEQRPVDTASILAWIKKLQNGVNDMYTKLVS